MAPAAELPATDDRRRRRTLIVEDDRTSRRALERLLRAHDHEACSAATLAEALAVVRAWRPECVVLDLMLPDGTGTAVLELVRREALPVRVAIATGAHGAIVSEAELLAPDAVFRKPLDVARLTAWLAAG